MGGFSSRFAFQVCATFAAVFAAGYACIAGDGPSSSGESARQAFYQRRAFDWMHGHGRPHGGRHHGVHNRGPGWVAPQVSAGWFQRPYPYHLDYYRMRYGGSYAPYFGNLYGPPQVVTAPPYYGPYYGGYDVPNGYLPPAYGNGAAEVQSVQQPESSQPPTYEQGNGSPPALPQSGD